MNDVYHQGEKYVQQQAGVERIAQQNGATIKSYMMNGVKRFIQSQPYMIAASVDQDRQTWCSLIIGEPGFIHPKDDTTIEMNASIMPSDPLRDNIIGNGEIGLLAIDFMRRMRLRINGKAAFAAENILVVQTEQVYGNCPKYIQKRSIPPDTPYKRIERSTQRSTELSPAMQSWIANSDTFFIASAASSGKADASHRGGMPGFVHVISEKVLVFPDYYGNSMFNTLGNIYENPQVGLLFINFSNGDTLQISGHAEIIWDQQEIEQYPGAERLVRFEVQQALVIENQSQLSWQLIEFSPANPGLGHKTPLWKGGDA